MKRYLEYYENEWPENIEELTAIENKPFVGYLKGGGVKYTVIPEPYVTFTAEEDNSSIGLTKLSTNQSLEYSADTTTWNTFDTTTNISLNNKDRVYIRGILSADNSSSNYTQFSMTGKIAASGNCNALWNYEDLEAPLKKYCGRSMFNGCAALTTAPELPATTLATYCYQQMFYGCTSLTTAPELPATTLATYCYNSMFSGCTSLTTAPELPAAKLTSYCYAGMFQNCTNLNKITCLATNIGSVVNTNYWVKNVSSTGTFTKNPDMTSWTTGSRGIPSGWAVTDFGVNYYTIDFVENGKLLETKVVKEGEIPTYTGAIPVKSYDEDSYYEFSEWYPEITAATSDFTYTAQLSLKELEPISGNYVTFTGEEANSTLGLNKLSTNQSLEYRTNDIGWVELNKATSITLANVDDKVYIRGILSANNSDTNYTTFKMTGKIAASGNCNAIWNYQDLNAPLKEYCGKYMFNLCSLTTAPELPATTLANHCYINMFHNCTSLTTAPELPATTLVSGCYRYMFSGCTSLTTAPELPAAKLTYYCYDGMFSGCTSLTTAPELPATTLAKYCYYRMFRGTALTTAPELPATKLSDYCYQEMFDGCSALTTAPELPATTLATYCYNSMFRNCTSLTTAPELPATTLANECYQEMFYGCASLTTAPELPATTVAAYCYEGMFRGCTTLTTTPTLPATTLVGACYQLMFYGCTSLINAPELPATTLAGHCYNSMFSGCTSLTTAPELPATTLATYCYEEMFKGCTALSSITCYATDISAICCTADWVNGVASSGTFIKAASMTSWSTGTRGIPSGWTVVDAEL